MIKTLQPIQIDTAPTKKEVLDSIDDLRKAIEAGEIIAFAAVGIEANDNARQWSGSIKHVTHLRMIGAMYHLLHCYENDL